MSNICKCHYQLTYFMWRKKNSPWEGNLLLWRMPYFPFHVCPCILQRAAHFARSCFTLHTLLLHTSQFALHISQAPRSTTTTHVSMLLYEDVTGFVNTSELFKGALQSENYVIVLTILGTEQPRTLISNIRQGYRFSGAFASKTKISYYLRHVISVCPHVSTPTHWWNLISGNFPKISLKKLQTLLKSDNIARFTFTLT
jgi:hypothetical protein